MKIHLALATLLALTIGAASFAPAYAMGDGDDSGTKPKCKKGEVVKNGKCVKAHSGVLPDEQLYQQGRALAQAGEYDWALTVLAAVGNQNDPRVLNYIGYSHRKSGRLDQAFGYYNKAIEIDPNFVLAREYLGEGYVAAGRVDLARLQLAEIANRCGTTCEEYLELAEHIETGVN
ncbi:tetratricopeptide repeat protein [Taklimakanibacter lacteus]|uniref:tetratricopeptide repeat protein n=1 Tax=Taklimakanibacter lacteus TaxID=2268456 RepID=UPI000E66C486